MNTQQRTTRLWAIPVILFVIKLLAALQPEPAGALPPRPLLETEDPPVVADGAAIELRVETPGTFSLAELQTTVQWQDGFGGWHNVDGWQGGLDELYLDGGRKTWYVAEEHFSAGPFRWIVYENPEASDGAWASEPFSLPAGPSQVVRTIVTVH